MFHNRTRSFVPFLTTYRYSSFRRLPLCFGSALRTARSLRLIRCSARSELKKAPRALKNGVHFLSRDAFKRRTRSSRPLSPGVTLPKRICQSAFLGQFLTHSIHRMHSVPFFLFLELSVTSTSIGHTLLHFPQETHFFLSHLTRISEK